MIALDNQVGMRTQNSPHNLEPSCISDVCNTPCPVTILSNINKMKEMKTHVKPIVLFCSIAPLFTAHDHHCSTRVLQKLFLDYFERTPLCTQALLVAITMMKMILLCEKNSYFRAHGTPTPGSASCWLWKDDKVEVSV